MDQPWSNYCAMSIVHFMAFPEVAGGQGPMVESLREIAEDDFFDAVEVAWISDAGIRRDVKQMLQTSQLQVGFCAHPTILSRKLNLNSLDQRERLQAVAELQELICQASELDANRFVFLSGPDSGDKDREAAMDVFLDSVHRLCAVAKTYGVGLTLETFDRRMDKRALIGPVRDAATVAKEIRRDYPDFGLLYDLSHMPLLDETPSDMRVIGEYLVHIHVGNCVKVAGRPLLGDLHPHFGFEGSANGVDELAEFVRGLFQVGYLADNKTPRPWVGFEVKPHGVAQTAKLVIANAKRIWRQAWSKV